MKIDVLTLDGQASGSIDLDDAIYALEPRADILHRVVVWQEAKARQGTRRVKTRGEVLYSTHKIVRQKGSGGARHGDRKVTQFRGGYKPHGPVVRSHAIGLPKKVRRLGLKMALSSKVKAQELIILDTAALSEGKTRELKSKLDKLKLTSALIIDGTAVDENFARAARNIPHLDVLPAQGLNVRDILRREKLVLTRAAVEQLEARLK